MQVECSFCTCLLFAQDDVSILYKTKLPFILVFNKTDVQPHEFAVEWMQDFEVFRAALASHGSTTDDEGEPTYMNNLMDSMSIVLDEFYKHLTVSLIMSLIVPMTRSLTLSTGGGCFKYDRRRYQGVLRRRRGVSLRI